MNYLKRILAKRWFRILGGIFVFMMAALLVCAWQFRIWGISDFEAYQGMRAECHPVWRDLHFGRIQAGDDIEKVILATRPLKIERYGDYVRLSYQAGHCFTGVLIIAKNGKLVYAGAGSCGWKKYFFDEMTEQDITDYDLAYKAHWEPIWKRQSEEAAARDKETKEQ